MLIAAAILLGSGAAAAIAAAVVVALIATAAVLVLAIAGLAAWLVYRTRRGQPVMRPSVIITSPDRAPLPPSSTAQALEPPGARELHWHLHFDGADPQEIAAIMRQIRKDNDADGN